MDGVDRLLKRLEKSGVSPSEVMRVSEIGQSNGVHLDIPAEIWRLYRVLEAVARTAPPGIGFHLGHLWQIDDYGPLGDVLRHCANLRQVSSVLKKYQALVHNFYFFSDRVVDDEWQIEFATATPLGAGAITVFEELLARSKHETTSYLGVAPRFLRVELAYPAPSHRKLYEDIFQCRVLFDRPRTVLVKSCDYLHYPIKGQASKRATVPPEPEASGTAVGPPDRIGWAILETLVLHPGAYPSLHYIAGKLGLSTRTLKRWLARGNTNYRTLVDRIRREQVAAYLAFTAATPKEIAYRSGFTNVHNFRRAFGRWTGMTPTQYRHLAVGKHEVLSSIH